MCDVTHDLYASPITNLHFLRPLLPWSMTYFIEGPYPIYPLKPYLTIASIKCLMFCIEK